MQVNQTCPVTGLKVSVHDYEPSWADTPAEIYHANKSALSSTGLRKALKSAALFKAHWTGAVQDEETEAMRFGRLAHLAILEPTKFMEGYVVEPVFEGRTQKGELTTNPNCKEVKEKRAAWLSDQRPGTIFVQEQELAQLTGMMNSILAHKDARACLTNGKAEISGYYRDKETELLCRIRPDFIKLSGEILVDIKTTRDCESWIFARDIRDRMYHVQMAMYCAGAEAITGVPVICPTLIAIEKKPPYEVAVYILDEGTMNRGKELYKAGLRRIKDSIVKNDWPGYQTEVQNIAIPGLEFTESLAVEI